MMAKKKQISTKKNQKQKTSMTIYDHHPSASLAKPHPTEALRTRAKPPAEAMGLQLSQGFGHLLPEMGSSGAKRNTWTEFVCSFFPSRVLPVFFWYVFVFQSLPGCLVCFLVVFPQSLPLFFGSRVYRVLWSACSRVCQGLFVPGFPVVVFVFKKKQMS